MRTVFTNSNFSRFDLGSYALSNPRALPQATLGIDLGEYQDKIREILGDLPVDQADVFKKQLDACLAMPEPVEQLACLVRLYMDVKDAKDKKPPVVTTTQPMAPASSFPIIPVAIAGVGALALIYALTKG